MIFPSSQATEPDFRRPDCDRKIRVMVVDNHPVVREGLKSILLRSPRIELAGASGCAEEALRVAINKGADLLVIDPKMSPMTGLELLWHLHHNQVACKALVLASSEMESEVLESMEAGAAGYLCKTMGSTELLNAIVAAASGQKIFPKAFDDGRLRSAARPSLTPRETEVLHLVSKGLSNKEVGRILGLSPFTVRNQLKRICAKLDASDRTEAATNAMERGMIRQ
jgi:DNA-binding NarL/FixJ family response regulator